MWWYIYPYKGIAGLEELKKSDDYRSTVKSYAKNTQNYRNGPKKHQHKRLVSEYKPRDRKCLERLKEEFHRRQHLEEVQQE